MFFTNIVMALTFILQSLVSSDETGTTDEEEEESQSDDHPDLGRLYFALRYDQHRLDNEKILGSFFLSTI